MMKTVDKLWGTEVWHENSELYCMKTLYIMPLFMSSLHCHRKKTETFLVVKGKVELEIDGEVRTLSYLDSVTILPGQYHRFRTIGQSGAVVVEASTMHSDDDVYRKEESRKI